MNGKYDICHPSSLTCSHGMFTLGISIDLRPSGSLSIFHWEILHDLRLSQASA